MKPSKEELEALYMGQRISPDEIAKRYAVSGRTIRNWLTEYDIPRLGPTHLRKGKSAVWNVGIERNEEYRKKQSDSRRGRPAYNAGQGRVRFNCEVCGTEVFDKPYRRSRTCSRHCKNELSHLHRGTEHWNYKAEAAGFRQRQRLWSECREWRIAVMAAADYTCCKCGQKGGRLSAHHKATWNNNEALRFEVSNGACLCWPCHWSFHRAYGHHNTTAAMLEEWLTK